MYLRFPGSLRWQLQLWHGLILGLVLSGFGWSAWQLQWASLFKSIDHQLEQHAQTVIHTMHLDRPPSGPGEPPRDPQPPHNGEKWEMGGAPPPPPGPPGNQFPPSGHAESNRRLPVRFNESSLYTIVWGLGGTEIRSFGHPPAGTIRPVSGLSHSFLRMRGDLREYIQFLPSGECVLVGENVREELSSLYKSALLLSGAGCVVLVLGLLIGGVITSGALRPLVSISSTARKISDGDLSQRIPPPREENEISDLVRVLNETFTRLESSFARQVQFTADASHELRTPISVVLTHAQNALSRERSSEEYRESLGACQRAARRMRQLTESLLALARLDNGNHGVGREVCRLDHIAGDALSLLGPMAMEQRVTVSYDPEPVSFTGNPEQISQVVINLISNAIRYNSAGGLVIVKITSDPEFATLSVHDTGQGIATEDIPHLFERFYRADKARSGNNGGAGLGLAITAAIIKAHGGTIDVRSELGAGSIFTVRLPV
jgi:two-component system OmpR family sensor kinase